MEDHPEDVCSPGCNQEHAFHYVRLLTGVSSPSNTPPFTWKAVRHPFLCVSNACNASLCGCKGNTARVMCLRSVFTNMYIGVLQAGRRLCTLT